MRWVRALLPGRMDCGPASGSSRQEELAVHTCRMATAQICSHQPALGQLLLRRSCSSAAPWTPLPAHRGHAHLPGRRCCSSPSSPTDAQRAGRRRATAARVFPFDQAWSPNVAAAVSSHGTIAPSGRRCGLQRRPAVELGGWCAVCGRRAARLVPTSAAALAPWQHVAQEDEHRVSGWRALDQQGRHVPSGWVHGWRPERPARCPAAPRRASRRSCLPSRSSPTWPSSSSCTSRARRPSSRWWASTFCSPLSVPPSPPASTVRPGRAGRRAGVLRR